MELSKRLQGVIGLMPKFDSICDVGCDHGYVAITFLQEKIAKRVIAMDVNKGPLEQAKYNAKLYGVADQLEFRLSDGLKEVKPGEADAFLLAGMGGKLMVRIMENSKDVLDLMKGAVLQPQSELALVRKYIYEIGWHIEKEDMVFEAEKDGVGKYYPMMYIAPGKVDTPNEAALLYGPKLMKMKHPVLMQYLQFSSNLKKDLLRRLELEATSPQAEIRKEELLAEIEEIQNILYEQ